MRLFWNGYELEGTVQEITEFININTPVTVYDYSYYKQLVNIPKIGPTDDDIKNLEILNKISRKATNKEMQ